MIFYLVIPAEFLLLFITSKYLVQALFAIFYKVFKKREPAAICVFVIFFPGVIIHELAHLLTAEVLFVKTGEFEISPKIEGSSLRMGSVQVARCDIFRSMLIGVAPIIIGTTVLITMLFAFLKFIPLDHLVQANILITTIVVWMVFLIANTMFSSRRDLEGVVGFLVFVAFLSIVAVITLSLLKVNFLQGLINLFENSWLLQGLREVSLLMTIPVFINLFVFILARFVVRKIY